MDNYMDLQRKHIYYALRWQIFLFIVIVFFISLLTVLCLHNCESILLCNHRRRHMGRRAQNLPSIPTASSKGLDPSVVKTIPTIVYTTTKATHFPPLECAICLSEFENDEKARVLPMCNHTFHVDCIDMWFYSHSNCPLCRAPVQADIPVNPPKTLEQTIIPVAETAGSEPPRGDFEMDSSFATAAASSSSSSSSPSSLKMESCPRKTLELTGILVEVPTGEDRLTGDADEDLGNRIPGVTRICSI